MTRDVNLRNATLSAAVAFAQDDIDPVGRVLVPMQNVGDDSSTDMLDLLLGVTQVTNRQ